MRIKKMLVIFAFIFTVLISMTACGDNDNKPVDTPEEQATEAPTEPPKPEVVEQAVPTADTKTSADALLGNWVDVSTPERFANVSKTDNGYQYEDNDSKYDAAFENGILKVKVSDTDTADVYIDANTGHLFLKYQTDLLEFKKK